MKILMIADNDPAGTAISFSNAVNRYTDHSCRLITREIRYNFMFEKDIHLPWLKEDEWTIVQELLQTSDVFHFHTITDEFIELGPFRPVDYMKGKCIVHHHHGHPDFRGNPQKYRQKYMINKRNNLLVSTPDLLHLLPEARWQPNLVPIDDSLYLPVDDKPVSPLIISHSPTRKDLKNTDEFLETIRHLQAGRKLPIELRLIENTPHIECLKQKRESHILFDHLQGYFGISSLEGLSQGVCVIAGLDEWNRKHILDFTGAEKVPWVTGEKNNLIALFDGLVDDRAFISKKSKEGRRFMELYWSPKKVAEQLVEILLGFE